MLEDLLKERAKKKEALQSAGYLLYPARVKRTHTNAALLKSFAVLVKGKKKVSVVGRIMGMRGQGGIVFLDLVDGTGKVQAVLKEENLKDFELFKNNLDIGDFVEIGGAPFLTKRGEKSVEAKTFLPIGKSMRPLPSVWHGLQDVEERFRRRYLDILLNKEVKENLEKRSEIVKTIRGFLEKSGFLEVETPMLQPIPGGAVARPFTTHHNALDVDFYLRVAPELYLKRLLAGGFEKVFEIGRNFRNEGIDRDHNPEFTVMEMYWAYADYEDLMKLTEKMLKPFISGKWERMTFAEAIRKFSGSDYKTLSADKLEDFFKQNVRPKIEKPTFITDYPEATMPLAKLREDNPELTESFQLIVNGVEIVKGFSEMNDPVVQREQMERQEADFRKGNEESSRKDEDFLEMLEYGMPPAAGLGIGIDRLVVLATGAHSVKEIMFFPTLRPKNEP